MASSITSQSQQRDSNRMIMLMMQQQSKMQLQMMQQMQQQQQAQQQQMMMFMQMTMGINNRQTTLAPNQSTSPYNHMFDSHSSTCSINTPTGQHQSNQDDYVIRLTNR